MARLHLAAAVALGSVSAVAFVALWVFAYIAAIYPDTRPVLTDVTGLTVLLWFVTGFLALIVEEFR